MKKLQLFFILILISTIGYAQNADITEPLKKADAALSEYNIEKAIRLYTDIASTNPKNSQVKEKLAAIYLTPGSNQDLNKANALYSEAFISGTMSPSGLMKYANLLQIQNNYEKARAVYAVYTSKGYSNSSIHKNLEPSYFFKLAESNPGIGIKNLDDINTANSDFSPCYYRGGLAYVSTKKNRALTGYRSQDEIVTNFTDIFKAKIIDKAKNNFEPSDLLLKAANQKYMQGPMTFSNEFGVMYITRSTSKDGKPYTMEDKKTVLMEICKVNYSKGDVENWDDVLPVVLNRGEGYQNYSYAHPAFVTGKGDELIFTSNMPGGYGGTDLWYSRLVGSEWATPVNLGNEVNTAGDEMFPFVSKEGTLFFASNGFPGLGGLDIYKALKIEGAKYGKTENIGAPYNSKFDDFGYIVNETGREGYFSSNRIGGKGLDDIYSWRTEETQLCIKVYDLISKNPVKNAAVKIPCLGNKTYYTDVTGITCVTVTALKDCEIKASADGFKNNSVKVKNLQANKIVEIGLEVDVEDKCKLVVIVLDKETKQPISNATVSIRQTSTNEEVDGLTRTDGTIRVKGISMNEFYEINATKVMQDGYQYVGIPESAICKGIKNGDSVIKTLFLRKVGEGIKIEIDNLYYDLAKWNIRPDAAIELDKVVSLLKQYPKWEIEMGSHTDCRATIIYNEDLSAKRAASCVEYLINKGIAPSRLSSKGYGESQLKNGCACEGRVKSKCSEADHQKNRRTEFEIKKM